MRMWSACWVCVWGGGTHMALTHPHTWPQPHLSSHLAATSLILTCTTLTHHHTHLAAPSPIITPGSTPTTVSFIPSGLHLSCPLPSYTLT